MRQRLIILTFLSLIFGTIVYGQANNQTIITKIYEIKNQEGDWAARNYVDSVRDKTTDRELYATMLSFWGILSSNIWQTDKSDSITNEYCEYLETIFIPSLTDSSFHINNGNFNICSQLTYDYTSMLYLKKDFRGTAHYLKLMLNWFDEIKEAQNSPDHMRILNDYCSVLINDLHQYKESIPYIEKDLALIEKNCGINSKEYAIALYNYSACLSGQEKRQEALETGKTALNIYQNQNDKDSTIVAIMLNGIQMNKMILTGEVLDINNMNDKDKNNLDLSECISLVLGGRGQEAIPSLLNKKQEEENKICIDTLNYANIITGLCMSYLSIGNTEEAHSCLNEFHKKYNMDLLPIPYREVCYSIMGNIYENIANFEIAYRFYKQAFFLHQKYGDRGIEYIKLLNHMASVNASFEDFLMSKWYIDEAIELYEKDGFEKEANTPLWYILLTQKANIYTKLKQFSIAELIYKEIIQQCKNSINNSEAFSYACSNLALLYIEQEKYLEADSVLQENNANIKYDNYNHIVPMLICDYLNHKQEKELKDLLLLNDVIKNQTLNAISNYSETEKDNFLSNMLIQLIFFNNLLAYNNQSHIFIDIAYNTNIFCKNLITNFHQQLDAFIKVSDNDDLKNQYAEYKEIRKRLTYKNIDYNTQIKMHSHALEIERNIYKSTPFLIKKIEDSIGRWQDIKNSLCANEVAIEFIYIPIMTKLSDITGYYGAFVLKRDFDFPKMILLDKVDDIEDIIYNNEPDELFLNILYSQDKMSKLYQMLWSKFEPYIEDTCTIYYSPTGYLSNLNFDLLCDKKGVLLGDKSNLIRVSSTIKIPIYKKTAEINISRTATLFGNIKYDEPVDEMVLESSAYDSFSGEDLSYNISLRSVDIRGRWGALPYTKNEIVNIQKSLEASNVKVASFEQNKGNEESFKALSGHSPDIIHLATHGFVIDTQNKAKGNRFAENISFYSNREGYLAWCGLMLAGSNNAWTGNFNLNNVEDGILTADEISRLDLSNTKLVVLSACETARGKIDPVEGVFGLQRAFKKAGAQTIVMSLWKVPDESTSILMTQFYKGLMSGTERHQALKDAMNYVKTLYPDPYYWAGFIMLD